MIPSDMIVTGDDDVGWSAKMPDDPNWCWAMKKETAIAGCTQRHNEVQAGTLIRGSDCFYRPLRK